jgi:hypothetical protein
MFYIIINEIKSKSIRMHISCMRPPINLVCVLLFRETREGFIAGGEGQPFFGEISGAGGPQGPASSGGVGVSTGRSNATMGQNTEGEEGETCDSLKALGAAKGCSWAL